MSIEALTFRQTTEEDLDSIVYMLSDDKMGSKRERYEHPLPESYINAVRAIDGDPNIELIVACDGDTVVGVQQVTFTRTLRTKADGEPPSKGFELLQQSVVKVWGVG